MTSIFRKEFTVSSYELNPRGKARLTTMANYFQEIAYQHANQLGFGYVQMKERRTLWMLSRMKISMKHYPVWNDTIVIETWPSGVDKLFALRDFRVRSSEGEIIGVATTSWLIVDLNSHRPIRPGVELAHFSEIAYGEPVFEARLEKINIPGEPEFLGKHSVVFSDLDIQGHVNNVKYMEWSIDAAMSGGLVDRAIVEFEINFLHEALPGDQVIIRGTEEMEKISASREKDGKEIIRAKISWK